MKERSEGVIAHMPSSYSPCSECSWNIQIQGGAGPAHHSLSTRDDEAEATSPGFPRETNYTIYSSKTKAKEVNANRKQANCHANCAATDTSKAIKDTAALQLNNTARRSALSARRALLPRRSCRYVLAWRMTHKANEWQMVLVRLWLPFLRDVDKSVKIYESLAQRNPPTQPLHTQGPLQCAYRVTGDSSGRVTYDGPDFG